MRKILLISLLLLAFLACTTSPDVPAFDNPLDPDEEGYEPPETTIDEAVIDGHSVTFKLGGNEYVHEFAYRLNGGAWSEWSPETVITIDYHDEGDYLFEAKGRYETGSEDKTPAARSYTIDDIHGPALWLSPRRVQVNGAGSFTLDLMAEDVADLMVVYAQVQFDQLWLTLSNCQILDQAGDFLTGNSGTVITIVDSLLNQGTIGFNLAIVGGTAPGVSGEGALVSLQFAALQQGTTEITLSPECSLINTDLGDIPIQELVSGLVEVGP